MYSLYHNTVCGFRVNDRGQLHPRYFFVCNNNMLPNIDFLHVFKRGLCIADQTELVKVGRDTSVPLNKCTSNDSAVDTQ